MVKGYGGTTSSGTLRKHLYTFHVQEWSDECDRLQGTIRSKDALRAIAAHRGVRAESQTQQRPKFTPENFVNTLAEFLVVSDQVCFNFYSVQTLLTLIFAFICSLSVLWRLDSSGIFFFS